MQLSYNEKGNPCNYKGNRKFIIFLAPKSFLFRTDCKGILEFIKKNLSNVQAKGRLLYWQLCLNQFFFSIERIQALKNSLTDSLIRELVNGDHHSRIPTEKGWNSKWHTITTRMGFSFCRILLDILEFHSKSRSYFGLLSFAYLLTQRVSVLDLQVHYLKCHYDVQTKISSYVQEKWFNNWYTACIDYYQNYSYDIWEAWSNIIFFFLIDLKLVVLDF